MNCIICNSRMELYFAKKFNEFGLGDVEYFKCGRCGFCASQTHFEMTVDQWAALNNAFHSASHQRTDNPRQRNQRYFNQALMLFLMNKKGLLHCEKWLDWGCGVGSVALLLKELFGIRLLAYDKYFAPQINATGKDQLVPGSFDCVVCTAVFEHVRDRETLNEIESYVKESGCLAVHTLVPETVPKDPGWMYLLPVHCAFHTNRSMQILMDDWGYACSVYNELSKMWVLFRQDPADVELRVSALNRALGYEYLHFKRGFMDYWK